MQLNITYRQILSVALPIIAGNFFHSVISFTDTIFMGRVGEVELAACGYASMYYMVLGMIGYSFALGAQIIIARRAGEHDRHSIGRVTDNLFYFLGAFSLLLFLFIRFGSRTVLGFMLPGQEVFDAATNYLDYRAFGVIFIYQIFVFGALFTGLGRTMIIIWSTLGMAILNIFLNYGLVFGNFGLPAMGIEGAGLASMLSEILAFLIMAIYLFATGYRKRFLLFRFKMPDFVLLRKILSLAGPIVLQSFVGALSWLTLFTMIVNYLGQQALAFSNVVKIIYTFSALPTWGLAGATNTFVSNVLGQGKPDLLFPLIKRISILSLAFVGLTMGFLMLYPQTVISLFTDDPALIQDYSNTLKVVMGALMLLSVGNILFRAVTGAGAARYALKIEVISVVIYVAFTFLVLDILNGGLPAAWSVEIIYWIALGALSAKYLASGTWKKLKI